MKLKTGCLLEYYSPYDIPLILLLTLYKGGEQTILEEEWTVEPSVPTTVYVDIYGNICQRMIVPEGKFVFRTSAIIETE